MNCILCGRPTKPAVILGTGAAVGPKCARKAGLIERARRQRGGYVRIVTPLRRPADPETMDLFSQEAE